MNKQIKLGSDIYAATGEIFQCFNCRCQVTEKETYLTIGEIGYCLDCGDDLARRITRTMFAQIMDLKNKQSIKKTKYEIMVKNED